MNAHDQPAATSRRRFFGRVGALIGAAGAAILLRPKQQTRSPDNTSDAQPAPKRGYRETEHVRKYYHKARF